MRAAIYARYSDDRQNPRSCEDQIAALREHAARRGWEIVAVFRDEAISGFAMANRPGINAALEAATSGAFEILLTEDESRIARNLGHLALIRDDLASLGIRISTLTTDAVEIMHVAFKGAFAQQYLADLGQKTARGMRANAERGLATGARKFGYRSKPGGEIEVVPEEAEIIVRIFELFADERLGGREIASRLNADQVPGPTGRFWNASTIMGEAKRGAGILRSEIYAGVKVWNRDEVRKDPRTGKRTHRYRPPAEWKTTPVEHLRILPQDLWDRAAARLRTEAPVSPGTRAAHRKGLLSGLLKCGCCGASYTSYSKTRLVCAGNRERGPAACANSKKVKRALVEERALQGLRERMLSPAAVRAYVRAYTAAMARIEAEKRASRAPLERKLGETERSIERIVRAVENGADTPAMFERLKALEADKAELLRQLDQAPPPAPVTIHPQAAGAYAALVENLQAELAEAGTDQADRKLVDGVRSLIEKIEIVPDAAAPGGVFLRLHGNLALLLAPTGSAGQTPPVSGGCLLVAGGEPGRTPPAHSGASGQTPPVSGGCLLVAGGGLSRTPPARAPANAPAYVFDIPLLAEAA